MSDDLVRYCQEEVHLGGGDVEIRYVESKDGWIASYADAKAALDAKDAEIARLRADLATARQDALAEIKQDTDESIEQGRQDGMEQAAQIAENCEYPWLEAREAEYEAADLMMGQIAAAIRAAAKEGK